MLLDTLCPVGSLARDDARFVAGPPPKVFAAIQQVCPAEVAGFGWVGRLTPFDPVRPLYAQMLGAGYTVLGTVPLREVVIGRVGSLARPFAPEPRVRDRRAFTAYDQRGAIKVLLGFGLAGEERDGGKGTRITASLRVARADAATPGGLAWVAPAILGVGGAVSRAFLAALAARVESA